MKKISKMLLSSVLTLLSVIVVIASLPKAQAVEAGVLQSNPIVLQDGVEHTKYWNGSNNHLNCFNKIVVPEPGYISLTISKSTVPIYGIANFYVLLYNESGEMVWEADTSAQEDSFFDYFYYKVGLEPGVYYMNLDTAFVLFDGSTTSTKYKYDFVKDDCWEIESNEDFSTATKIEPEKMYGGMFNEQTYYVSYKDCFAVELNADEKYTVKIENYKKLSFSIYDSTGEEIPCLNEKNIGNITQWDINVNETGVYYLCITSYIKSDPVVYKLGIFRRIIPASQLTFKLSKTSYAYDGKVKKPTVTVKFGDEKLVQNTHYTVEYGSGRKNVGEYKVTVKLKGSYTGTKTLKFKIVPKTIDKTKITATQTTKTITLKWPKVSGATGYKVYQYNSSKSKYVLAGTVTKNTFKKSNLKAGNTYKFRVTAYKKLSNGNILEGAQSKVFTTATKCATPQIVRMSKCTWGNEYFLKLKKVNGATGYEVYCSDKKNSGFKKAKLKYDLGYYFTPAKVYKNKRVYVKIRAYKTVNGKKIYSAWSSIKSVKD